jgi:hypothetical protein
MVRIDQRHFMNQNGNSPIRVAAVAVGYVLIALGCLYLFTAPFYLCAGLVVAGLTVAFLADRSKAQIPVTWTSQFVLYGGCAALFCVFTYLGWDKVRNWTFQILCTWFVFFGGFRHVRHLILHRVEVQ